MQWDIGFSVTLYKLKYLRCVVEATEKIYWFLSNIPDTIVWGEERHCTRYALLTHMFPYLYFIYSTHIEDKKF